MEEIRACSPRRDSEIELEELEQRLETSFPLAAQVDADAPCIWACECFAQYLLLY